MEGFSNINVDLMSAIPGQTVESWRNTLRKVIMLKPEHISAYSLIIEEGTPFYETYGAMKADLERYGGMGRTFPPGKESRLSGDASSSGGGGGSRDVPYDKGISHGTGIRPL